MSIATGDRVGPYEIQDRLGAGGMGEVFRAQDTRLGRSVAVKTSAERFNERFEREARLVASLNHPNICTLFDVGPDYLVMELVDGPTLAERLEQGPIPLEEALVIARQIADALQAAHEKGIVHRDLKPANIKLRLDGTVKVLDFGLATTGGAVATAATTADSPTFTMGPTGAGTILGTAGYMAPEQARGKPVDKRADIWAFGVVLYEMLTGTMMFGGAETVSDALAAVLTKEPDLEHVPVKVRRLLHSCLEKDPKKRLHDIGDYPFLLEETPAVASVAPPGRWQRLWPAVAALLALAVAALVFLYLRRTAPPAETLRLQIPVPENVTLPATGVFALSPDSRKVVFAGIENGEQKLWIRFMDSLDARPLAGTNWSRAVPPFWSPDSRFIVFEAEGKLKKVDINGGPPQTICDSPANGTPLGGSWNRDNTIIFGATGHGIMRVSAAGGTATPVTVLDRSRKDAHHLYPVFLPDGKHFLYLRFPSDASDAGVYIGSLDARPEQQSTKPLFTTARASIAYVPTLDSSRGQLLFFRDGAVYAQTLNHRRLALEGKPRAILEQVGYNSNFAFTMVSATANALVYRHGANSDLQLTWLDRSGKVVGTVGEAGLYGSVVLSRDGSRAAVSKIDPATHNQDIWLIDLKGGGGTRFTFDPAADVNPVWSPDGSRVIFASGRGDMPGLYEKAANGAGAETVLLKPSPAVALSDWSRDGRYAIFSGGGAIWVLPLEGDRKPIPFLRNQFGPTAGRLSPDERWIAFRSEETGRAEIYVESFTPVADAGTAASTGKWMISLGGGTGMNHWRQDGKELYYLSPDGSVMAVPVTTSPVFHAGTPERLFALPGGFVSLLGDVSPDGQKFLVALPKAGDARQQFTVVTNWDDGPKK